jgi:hypothetical protein
LGVGGDVRRAFVGEPFVFAAKPGSTDFQRVDVPSIAGAQSFVLRADNDGFDLIGTTIGRGGDGTNAVSKLVALHSVDGQTWSANDAAPQEIDYVTAVGRHDGRIVVVGGGKNGGVVLVDNGAGGWTSTSLADVVPAAVRGNRSVYVMSAAVGPLGVVATVSLDQTTKNEPYAPKYRVLATRDLETWSDDSYNSLAGEGVSPNNVVMVGDHVVISGFHFDDVAKPGPVEAVALSGTPQ